MERDLGDSWLHRFETGLAPACKRVLSRAWKCRLGIAFAIDLVGTRQGALR
jgi:hypothetical protein